MSINRIHSLHTILLNGEELTRFPGINIDLIRTMVPDATARHRLTLSVESNSAWCTDGAPEREVGFFGWDACSNGLAISNHQINAGLLRVGTRSGGMQALERMLAHAQQNTLCPALLPVSPGQVSVYTTMSSKGTLKKRDTPKKRLMDAAIKAGVLLDGVYDGDLMMGYQFNAESGITLEQAILLAAVIATPPAQTMGGVSTWGWNVDVLVAASPKAAAA